MSDPSFKTLSQGAGLAWPLQWPRAPMAGLGPCQQLEVFLTGTAARASASARVSPARDSGPGEAGPGQWPRPGGTVQQQRGQPNLKSF